MNNIIITYKNLQDESKVRLKIRDSYGYKVIAVPRQISVTCGIAHKISEDTFNDIYSIIKECIDNNDIEESNVHYYKEIDNETYVKIDINKLKEN